MKNFTSWDRKSVHPPPDFGKPKPEQPEVMADGFGLPLSYSWTQRTLLHQTHKCGYQHLYGAKLAFFDILSFIAKFLKLFIL